jgi:hypothetical protein
LANKERYELLFIKVIVICRNSTNTYDDRDHLKSKQDGISKLFLLLSKLSFLPGNTFQNLNVSSPAPVTIEVPSGEQAK